MSSESSGSFAGYLTKSRLEALIDGIFAFAMTLLVIGLTIPDRANIIQTNEYAFQILVSLYGNFFHYVLAFLILAAFWVGLHIEFHSIRTIDKNFLWINLVTLMFVALLPFSTQYYGVFDDTAIGPIVFEANLLALGIGMSIIWWYATDQYRLIESETGYRHIRKISLRNITVPVVSIVAIGVAMAGSTWSSSLYLSLPAIDWVIERRYQ